MAYEVLARKWRPQQFDDVVGQDHVVQTLKNAIEEKRLAHAYLFVGPRGIGKTSIARIFAKALNCSSGPIVKPCDKCDSCREITSGTSLDVMEIDGASNNSVDQIRDLRETVRYLPVHGTFKIYIIDEVHMLSVAAFNALLKTLEEPPAHVKFFFATTEPERVLPTIVSRCQRFDLRRIPVQLLVERLNLIAKSEKVKVSPEALLAVARGAEGGLRDAESALDQLISFKGKEITEDDVLSVFGLVSQKTLENLAEKIMTGDIKALLKIVSDLDKGGKDLQRLVLELMEHFRNLLVCQHTDEAESHLDLTDAQIEVLKKQSKLADTSRILRVTGILGETEDKMRRALSRRTLLEVSLVRCARAVTVVSLEEILAKINGLRESSPPIESGGAGKRSAAEIESNASADTGEQSSGVAEHYVSPSPLPDEAQPDNDELAMLVKIWPETLAKIGQVAPFTKNTLRDSRPLAVKPDRVIVGLDAEFAGEKEKLTASRDKLAVERVLSRIVKREVAVEFKIAEMDLDEESERVPEKKTTGKGSTEGGQEHHGKAKHASSPDDMTEHPLVKEAQDLFGGRVIAVRK
jgi:DNA polymerase III subunit gamma/tau